MENEMMLQNQMENAIQEISVIQGSVVFGAYQELKQQATDLAEQIRTVEVSEDNLKLSKKLLAEVNKRVKTLEDKRISIKKMMLEPYQEFEDQVKEIVGIVKEADSFVRDQVKELEEAERDQKKIQLYRLWQLRVEHYSFSELVPFDDFIQSKHLTKTISIDAVEKEMVQFMEKIERDMDVLKTLEDVDAHINAYLNCYDLAQTMTKVKQEKERKEQIEQARKKSTKKSEVQNLFQFTVYNEKDANFIELFLQSNNIKFEKQKG